MAYPTDYSDDVWTGSTTLNAASHLDMHAAVEKVVGKTSDTTTTTHTYKLSGVTGTDKSVSLTGTETLTNKTLTTPTLTTPKVDTINEATAAAGVTVDGLLIKDSGPTGWDGWMTANETWTYASASTFTVAADVRTKYPIGTKIKWTQTTVKYGIITATAYSSPNTTVTIAVNTDYTVANATISANYYSYEAIPQGFPSSFNWAPVFDGFSSNPTGTFRFQVQGRTCFIDLAMTGDGTSDSAVFEVVLPIASARSSGTFGAWANAKDNGSWLTTAGWIEYNGVATEIALGKVRGVSDGWTASGAKRAYLSGWYFI